MDQKLVLVEEDRYKALMNRSKNPLNEYDRDHLKIAKQDLDEIYNNPDINASTKNVLYNNALKNYLKKAKTARERPIDINIKNDVMEELKALLNNIQSSANFVNTPQNTTTLSLPQPQATTTLSLPQSQTATPLSLPQSTNNISSSNSPDPLFLSTVKTPEDIFAAPLNHSNTKVWEKINISDNDKRIEELSNHLLENYSDFNLTKEGKVLGRDGKPVRNSSYKDIAKYLIENSNKNSPVGFKNVRDAVFDNSKVKEIRYRVNKWGAK